MEDRGKPVLSRMVDRLRVRVYPSRRAMGEAAGNDVAELMRRLLAGKRELRMIFAAAPSQNETLAALARAGGIDWSRVTAFHMDEYIGLADDAPQRFGRYLREHIFDLVKPGKVHFIDSGNRADEECRRYSALLREGPIDIV